MPVQDEIFDVVDDADLVIGQRTRREVHAEGLKHRAVHLLVFNAAGQVFLQKRSMLKDTHPGTWDSSAAGHLDSGESYDASVVREVREELGVTLDCTPERIMRLEARAETGQEFVWVYRCTHEGPFELHPEEIERGEWFDPEFVTRWIAERPRDFAPSLICIWRKLHPAK